MMYTATICLILTYINISRGATIESVGTGTIDAACGTVANGDCNGRKGATYTCSSDAVTMYGSGADGNCYYQSEGGEVVCVNVKSEATCPAEGDPCDTCTSMGLKEGICPDGITTFGFIGCAYGSDSNDATKTLQCLPITTDENDCPSATKCCPVLEEPGQFGNPISFEGHRCCPDGTWGFSIGDATTFSCGGNLITSGFGQRCANPCDTARCAGPGCCRPYSNDPTQPKCVGNIIDENNQCMEISCETFDNCAQLFDGCNTCICDSTTGTCTDAECATYEEPSCAVCVAGFELNGGVCEAELVCDKDEVKVQREKTITCEADPCGSDENCATYNDGCNTYEDCDTDLIIVTELKHCGNVQQGESKCEKCVDGYILNEAGICVPITCDTFANCAVYNDGCNDCTCGDNGLDGCTKMHCEPYGDAFCVECENGYDFNAGDCVETTSTCPNGEILRANGECITDPCGDNCVGYYDGCNNCKCDGECAVNVCKTYTTAICNACEDGYSVNEKGICVEDAFMCGENCVTYTNGCQECKCESNECDMSRVCITQGEEKCIGCADGYEITDDGECVEIVDEDCEVYGFEPEEVEKRICSICVREKPVESKRKICRTIRKIGDKIERNWEIPDGTLEEAECMLKYCQSQPGTDLNCPLQYVKLRDDIITVDDFLSVENCNCNAFECDDSQVALGGKDKLGVFVGFSIVVFNVFGWM